MLFADVGRDIEQFALAAVKVVYQLPCSGADGAGGSYARAGQLCRQGLTFAARLRYTGRGHKNRGAVRLRSALSGVPFT